MATERPGPGDPRNGKDRHFANPAAEDWSNYHAEVKGYKIDQDDQKSRIYLPNGDFYIPSSGELLIINGEVVMDTAEFPWAERLANMVIDEEAKDVSGPLIILEVGFGLGLTAGRFIRKLVGREEGGEYHFIELNKDVYQRGLDFKKKWERRFIEMAKDPGQSKPNVKIVPHFGDAAEVLPELIQTMEGQVWHTTVDTYPIEEGQRGINDLLYGSYINRLLVRKKEGRKGGMMAWFPFYPGSDNPEGITSKQFQIAHEEFDIITSVQVHGVKPSRNNPNLWIAGEPATTLPIGICKDPKN